MWSFLILLRHLRFGTITQCVLLSMVRYLSIDGAILDWLGDFLVRRTMSVCVSGVCVVMPSMLLVEFLRVQYWSLVVSYLCQFSSFLHCK